MTVRINFLQWTTNYKFSHQRTNVYNPTIIMYTDLVIQIIAISAGSGALIVLSYLSFLLPGKGLRFGLMLVFFHTVNYFTGIIVYVNYEIFLLSFTVEFLYVIQLLSMTCLLYFAMRFIESLGQPRLPVFLLTGRLILPFPVLTGILYIFTSIRWINIVSILFILLFGVFLWIYLFLIKTEHPLCRAVRKTGLIGYSLIIPGFALQWLLPNILSIHPMDAVSFLFMTISALFFSIYYLLKRKSFPGNTYSPLDIQQQYGLTDREAEVMELLTNSCSYKEIAFSLGISMPTVKTHVSRIYKKTGTSGRSELKFRFRRSK